MRNPFRRQTETAAPTLRERAASLRTSLRPIPAAPAALPAPGSPEAMAAWHSACNEHSKRSAPLHEYAELMDPSGGFWTKASLGRALETGGISVAEYARLHPMASERELRLDQIGHELNTAALFALAYADEYPQKPEAQNKSDSPAGLTAAILDGWAAWGAVQDKSNDDVQAETDARRRALIHAAMDLPATVENITAKALACSWMEWIEAERPGTSRDAYSRPDQLVYDLHTAIMARGGTGKAFEPRPADLLAAAGLSLEALPASDLCSIFDAADTLSAVAAGLTCQPRQMTKQGFNSAGRLIENTAFALHAVMEAVAKELRSRTLTDASEQGRRAATLARLTIDNGDKTETAAFARELLAMVER